MTDYGIVGYSMCDSFGPYITVFRESDMSYNGDVTHEEHNGNFIITYESVPLAERCNSEEWL